MLGPQRKRKKVLRPWKENATSAVLGIVGDQLKKKVKLLPPQMSRPLRR